MKLVLVIRGKYLLSDGIASILAEERDLRIVNTSFVNWETLLEEIEAIKPSVLLFEDNHHSDEFSELINLLKSTQDFRVVIVDASKNIIHVYNKQKKVVAQSADLIAAITA